MNETGYAYIACFTPVRLFVEGENVMSDNPQNEAISDFESQLESQMLAEFQAAYDKYQGQAKAEMAAPHRWWDIYLRGPFQPGATTMPPRPIGSGPLLPHRVIRVGETFYFTVVLYLNPDYPSGLSACNLLTSMGCPYEINFFSGSLQSWGPAPYNDTLTGSFTPNGCWFYRSVGFRAQRPDLVEMNVNARIMNCGGAPLPHFGGFATAVELFDSSMFGPGPGFSFNIGARFMITE